MKKIKNKKIFLFKIISLVILNILMLTMSLPLISLSETGVIIAIENDAKQIKKGDTVNVNIIVKNDSIKGFSGFLDYDTSIFSDVTKNDFELSENLENGKYGSWSLKYNTSTKKVMITEDYGDAYNIPDGIIATLQLRAIADADSSTVTFSTVEVDGTTDISGDDGYHEIEKIETIIPKPVSSHTVTYDYTTNGGTSVSKTSDLKEENDAIDLTATATKEGWNFVGWNTDKNAKTGLDSLDMEKDDVTLYAIFSKELTVSCYYYDISATQKIERVTGIIYNNETSVDVNLPSITEEYVDEKGKIWTCNGWTKSTSNGETTGITGGTPVTIDSDVNYYMLYKRNININYHVNGGDSNAPRTQKGEIRLNASDIRNIKGADITISNEIPIREGYVFANKWNTTTSSSGTSYVSDAVYNFTDDITLYAEWTAGTNTAYKVEHYKQQENGTYLSTPDETENLAGITGAEVTAVAKTYDGYIEDTTNDNRVISGIIAEDGSLVLKIYYKKLYTITLDANGGELTSTNTIQKAYGETYGELPTPTKLGYKFLGWYDSQVGGNKIENNAKITSSHTLYAQWKDNTHTVEFIGKDSNGQDTVLATAIIEHGSDITASILSEQGINISDLQKDVNTQEYYYKYIGMETAKFNNITEDRQIKILYENTKNSYTITFYDEDKTTILGTATAEYGANADGSHIIPKKSEDQTHTYVFSGWVDNEGNIDDLGNVIENRNVYATYTPTYKVYKVEFVNDDGSFISDKKDYHYGDNIVIPNNPTKAPTKQYTYIFEGWMDSENNLIDLSKIQVTENAIYTAKYRQELNKYTITFYLDSNKTQKIGESTVDYGTNATYTGEIPIKAEENGYKFTFDKWINKENNEDDLSNVTENRDVIASFIKTPIVYNIEYIDTMGADNSNPLTYTIEDENITLNKLPDIKGMKFIGWFTDTTYTTQINSIITKDLGNIKVYAKWDIEDLYLKSQKYKIGENNVDEYEENDIYLYRVNPNTTLTDFISNCDTNGTITVYKKTGEKLGDNEIIGTGMTLKDELNGKVIILTLSVKGDIDGNGKVTATDLAAINQQILKEISLEGAQFKAADISDDKQVTATDLAAINQVILKELDLSTIK